MGSEKGGDKEDGNLGVDFCGSGVRSGEGEGGQCFDLVFSKKGNTMWGLGIEPGS